jgi:hypothetical protein
MNAIKLVPVLCAFSLIAGLTFAEITEAKMRPHRRCVSDRYHRHRYEERLRHASPGAEDIRRYSQDRSGGEWNNKCFFSLRYLPEQYACPKGDGE